VYSLVWLGHFSLENIYAASASATGGMDAAAPDGDIPRGLSPRAHNRAREWVWLRPPAAAPDVGTLRFEQNSAPAR